MMDTATKLEGNTDLKFWLLFEQAAVGIAVLSPTGRYLRANPEFCRLLGYAEDQLRALTFRDITHPNEIAARDELQNKLLAGEIATYRTETRYIRGDGYLVWAFVSVSLVRDDAGVPMHSIAVIQDITERKQAQDELGQARSRYQAVCDNAQELISVNDLRGRFLFVSNSSLALLGYTPAELLGADLFRYIHPDDRDLVYEAFRKFSEGALEPLLIRYRAFHKDGNYTWIESFVSPVGSVTGQEREVVSVSRDLSEPLPPRKPLPIDNLSADPTEEHFTTDDLTRLRDKQSCDDLLGRKLVSPRSASFPFGVLVVDIDSFARYNSMFGREIGDKILERVAQTMQATCRTGDCVARYGDDEFMVVLPSANPGGTITLGEKLIQNVKAIDWSDTPLTGQVTISVGATCVTYGSNITLPELIDIVSQQLTQAKESGGNCLIMNTRQTIQRIGKH